MGIEEMDAAETAAGAQVAERAPTRAAVQRAAGGGAGFFATSNITPLTARVCHF